MNSAANAVERTGYQFQGHEGARWKGVGKQTGLGARKAKPGIVVRMAKNEDGSLAPCTQPIQPEANELAADALTLVCGQDGQRRESNRQDRVIGPFLDQYAAEQDMANDGPLMLRHEGTQHSPFMSQASYQIGFFRSPKTSVVHDPDGAFIVSSLGTNKHFAGRRRVTRRSTRSAL